MFLQKRRDGKVSQYLTALQCRYFGHIPSADITIKLSSSRKCCTILTRRMIKSWWWNKKIGECFFVRILFIIDSKLIVTNNEDKKTLHCDRLTVSHSGDGPRVPFWNVRIEGWILEHCTIKAEGQTQNSGGWLDVWSNEWNK